MKRILLVEDDPNLADGLLMNLEADGYEVVHIEHGRQALDEFQRGNYDLVLLDIMLPGMDGLTICKNIRDSGSTVPILFITVACGACSGFHGIVSSGTTSKQVSRYKDSLPIGYGSMLLEGLVAGVPAVVANGYIGTAQRADGTTFPLPAGAVQFDEQPAARDVDQPRAGRQHRQAPRIEQAVGFRGERRQQDQHAAAAQEAGQRVGPAQALDAGQIARHAQGGVALGLDVGIDVVEARQQGLGGVPDQVDRPLQFLLSAPAFGLGRGHEVVGQFLELGGGDTACPRGGVGDRRAGGAGGMEPDRHGRDQHGGDTNPGRREPDHDGHGDRHDGDQRGLSCGCQTYSPKDVGGYGI